MQLKSSKRPTFGMLDRQIFARLYHLAPKVLGALAIVKPETVIKGHRAGFRSYLAVEVALPLCPTHCSLRSQAYLRDEHCQSAVGRSGGSNYLLKADALVAQRRR